MDGGSVQGHMCPVARSGTADGIWGQPESAEESDKDQTPLSGRTRSARASQPRYLIIPPAAIPDDSEDINSDDNLPPVTKAKPKNKYEKWVLRMVATKKRIAGRGY